MKMSNKNCTIWCLQIFLCVASAKALHDCKNDNGMPDFIVVGVTKCGTTSLFNYLTEHPKIDAKDHPKTIGSKKKEIHFFDRYYKKGINWYKQQFPQKNDKDTLIGESTPCYFWKKKCLEKIAQHCPNTKFIVIFRDPVKRMISAYLWREHDADLASFKKTNFPLRIQNDYLSAGSYIMHLQRWLKYFPKEQIHIVILEDLMANPGLEVNKVFRFLGLADYKLHSYQIYNQTKLKLNVEPQLLKALKKFYAPYNKQLEKYLGRTLPWQ